jgi:hypothetical protein
LWNELKTTKFFGEFNGTGVLTNSIIAVSQAPMVEYTTDELNLSNKWWLSRQAGHQIFQLHTKGNCRVLTPNFITTKFTVQKRAHTGWPRSFFRLISLPDLSQLVIGGHDGDTYLSTVSLYSMTTDTWRNDLPELNVARGNSGSTLVHGFAYVIAG